jgi:hypothetical protein
LQIFACIDGVPAYAGTDPNRAEAAAVVATANATLCTGVCIWVLSLSKGWVLRLMGVRPTKEAVVGLANGLTIKDA